MESFKLVIIRFQANPKFLLCFKRKHFGASCTEHYKFANGNNLKIYLMLICQTQQDVILQASGYIIVGCLDFGIMKILHSYKYLIS